MRQEIEVLAPAGDYDTLRAAVCAGADAVYVGGERFGARAYAKNFTTEELLDAIDYVHLHGRKLYLTVNTLVKEREFSELYAYLLPLYMQGLDAVIVQDVGVMDYILKQFPGFSVHASTQMTVTSAISAKYLESLGVERVVPARELSLTEIREIRDNTELEIECFVHGALCYCYSGQCLLSSMIGGRSGNRGQCAQPCRLPYRIDHGRATDILSLKDLCTVQHIPALIENGITSFKIEGRMKQPEYVATVTGIYRKYVDLYLERGSESYAVSESDKRKLEQAYQRRGYCDGYYYRHNGKEMLSSGRQKRESSVRESVPDMKCQEKINGVLRLSSGKRATLYLNCRNVETELSGMEVETAANHPVTAERLEKQMRKTGNTPFVFDRIDISVDGEVFLPMQAVNELRRRGLEQLENRIVERFRRDVPDRMKIPGYTVCEKAPQGRIPLTASVESMEQLETVVACPEVSRIYVEDALWAVRGNRESVKKLVRDARNHGKQLYFAMARIFRKEAQTFYDRYWETLSEVFDGALVRNLESFLYVREHDENFPVATDSGVYQWNRYAKNWWKHRGIETAAAPIELNRWELKELGIQNMEMIVYGYLPVMVTAGCVRKNTSGCDGRVDRLILEDRQHNKNIVKNECVYCYNVIYNKVPLMLWDQYLALQELEPKALRLQFTVESREKTRNILELYSAMDLQEQKYSMPDMEFTRGHFKRGVK